MEIDTYVPVRCYSCGSILGRFQIGYEKLRQQGFTPKEAMDKLGIHPDKYCCRMNILSAVQIPVVAPTPAQSLSRGAAEQQLSDEMVYRQELENQQKQLSSRPGPAPVFEEAMIVERVRPNQSFIQVTTLKRTPPPTVGSRPRQVVIPLAKLATATTTTLQVPSMTMGQTQTSYVLAPTVTETSTTVPMATLGLGPTTQALAQLPALPTAALTQPTASLTGITQGLGQLTLVQPQTFQTSIPQTIPTPVAIPTPIAIPTGVDTLPISTPTVATTAKPKISKLQPIAKPKRK